LPPGTSPTIGIAEEGADLVHLLNSKAPFARERLGELVLLHAEMTGEVDLPQAALLEASFDLVRIHGWDVALSCEHRNYEDRKFLLANEFRLSHIGAMWTDSPPRSSLPKELYADADVIEKARAMLRAGGSEAYVSDYLGMKPAQVDEIRRELGAAVRERPPAPIADDAGAEDRKAAEARRLDAECGSAALLAAIRRYLARHHPNDSAEEQG
jgi:hypothetical protein